MIGQCHTQAILRKHLASYGSTVELGTECRSVEQFPDHVVVTTAKTEGGKETVTSASYRWVIAADGGKSELHLQWDTHGDDLTFSFAHQARSGNSWGYHSTASVYQNV